MLFNNCLVLPIPIYDKKMEEIDVFTFYREIEISSLICAFLNAFSHFLV